jgi:hypothetical protein
MDSRLQSLSLDLIFNKYVEYIINLIFFTTNLNLILFTIVISYINMHYQWEDIIYFLFRFLVKPFRVEGNKHFKSFNKQL